MNELRERLLAAIATDASPTRRIATRMRVQLLVSAGAVSIAAWIAAGGIRPTGRPAVLMIATFAGAAAVATVALLLALCRGRSMLGRSAPALIGMTLATPALLLAWKIGVSVHFPGMTVPWPGRAGFRCLYVATSTGIAPFAAFLHVWRHTQPAHPRLTGLAIGTAAGAVTWGLVDLWCPVAYAGHLLLGHLLPVIVFAALGGAAGGSLLAAKTR